MESIISTESVTPIDSTTAIIDILIDGEKLGNGPFVTSSGPEDLAWFLEYL